MMDFNLHNCNSFGYTHTTLTRSVMYNPIHTRVPKINSSYLLTIQLTPSVYLDRPSILQTVMNAFKATIHQNPLRPGHQPEFKFHCHSTLNHHIICAECTSTLIFFQCYLFYQAPLQVYWITFNATPGKHLWNIK